MFINIVHFKTTIEYKSDGVVIKSINNIKPTIKIIIERKNLKCSPLRKFENFDPIWTPMTEPRSNKNANIISTVWFCEAWSIVVLEATKIIWKSEVPTTKDVGIPKRYIIAGTIINPPPVPIKAAKMPTIIPLYKTH